MNWISIIVSCILIISIGLLASGHGWWAGVLSVVPIKMLTATWIVGSGNGPLGEVAMGMIIGSVASLFFAMMVIFIVVNGGNHWYAMIGGLSVWASVIILGRTI